MHYKYFWHNFKDNREKIRSPYLPLFSSFHTLLDANDMVANKEKNNCAYERF